MKQVIKKWELILKQDKDKNITYDRNILKEILTDIKQVNEANTSVEKCTLHNVSQRFCGTCKHAYTDDDIDYWICRKDDKRNKINNVLRDNCSDWENFS